MHCLNLCTALGLWELMVLPMPNSPEAFLFLIRVLVVCVPKGRKAAMGKEEFGKRKRETVLHVINPSLSWCGCPKLRSRQWKKCCTCPLSFAVFVVNLALFPRHGPAVREAKTHPTGRLGSLSMDVVLLLQHLPPLLLGVVRALQVVDAKPRRSPICVLFFFGHLVSFFSFFCGGGATANPKKWVKKNIQCYSSRCSTAKGQEQVLISRAAFGSK